MPLAYYSAAASADFWAEHWGRHSPESLARSAETSPLTRLIWRHLPVRGSRVLEAGCGLGQYVVLMRQAGYRAIGADWTPDPLQACRAWMPGTPLAVMELRCLAFGPETFAAYVSLGVVEHDPDGPDAILREARRVLAPRGVLIVSVPFVNVARRCVAWWVRHRNERRRAAGAQFYQYAYSHRETRAFIERNGFDVVSATPYDPARLLRASWQRARRGLRGGARDRSTSAAPPRDDGRAGRRGVERLAKRLLYTRVALLALGHMILFVAVKR